MDNKTMTDEPRCDCQGRPLPPEQIEKTRLGVMAAAENALLQELRRSDAAQGLSHARIAAEFTPDIDPQELALALFRNGAELLLIYGSYELPEELRSRWSDRMLVDPEPQQVQQAGYEVWLDKHNARLATRKCWLHSIDY